MPINFLESLNFQELFSLMNVDKNLDSEFDFKVSWSDAGKSFIERLREGIEIDIEDLEYAPDGTLEYKGQKVLVYIRDLHSNGSYEVSLPKAHLSDCRTLQKMRMGGRYDRYVVTQNLSGIFTVNIDGETSQEELFVCKNCLDNLDYQEYGQESPAKKKMIFNSFSYNDFFSLFENTIGSLPKHTENTAPSGEYTKDWKEISRKVKKARNWTCENGDCGFMPEDKKDKQYIECHHINGVRSDNRLSNLKVLCVKCHADQPFHDHVKHSKSFKKFLGRLENDQKHF